MSDDQCVDASQALGRGDAEVHIMFRGGLRDLGTVDFKSLTWSRRLDTWGEATATIDVDDCCSPLSILTDIEPLAHELVIYRSDNTGVRDGFAGPIVTIDLDGSTLRLYARSLDWWWDRVVVLGGYSGHPRQAFAEIVSTTEDQLSLGMVGFPIVRDDDILIGERVSERIQARQLASSLGDTGMHYTMIGRTVVYGEHLHGNDLDSVMTELSAADLFEPRSLSIRKSGLNYSSRVTMPDETAKGGYVTAVDSVPEAYYGVAENLYTERSADESGISTRQQVAEKLASQNRVKFSIPRQTQVLNERANIMFDELIPGMPVRFADTVYCNDFDELLSLGDISFEYGGESGGNKDEKVSIELAPMNFTDTIEVE